MASANQRNIKPNNNQLNLYRHTLKRKAREEKRKKQKGDKKDINVEFNEAKIQVHR